MGNLISQLLYQPPEASYPVENPGILWLETTSGARVPAFHVNKRATVTVLFSHGNAEDIGLIYDWFTIFSDRLNVNVFLYEYEGYGRSRGNRSFNVENKPNDASCYEDIDAAWNYLTKTLRVDSSSIVIYGRSLGSGPSCYLAERLSHQHVTIGGLVLQSPLLSVYRVAFDFRFTLPWDMFPNVDRVANITTPTWILHGTKDEIVPFWNGEQLFLACPLKFRAKPYWADGAGHNNVESLTSNSSEFFHQFSNFLKEHVPRYGGDGGSSLGG